MSTPAFLPPHRFWTLWHWCLEASAPFPDPPPSVEEMRALEQDLYRRLDCFGRLNRDLAARGWGLDPAARDARIETAIETLRRRLTIWQWLGRPEDASPDPTWTLDEIRDTYRRSLQALTDLEVVLRRWAPPAADVFEEGRRQFREALYAWEALARSESAPSEAFGDAESWGLGRLRALADTLRRLEQKRAGLWQQMARRLR